MTCVKDLLHTEKGEKRNHINQPPTPSFLPKKLKQVLKTIKDVLLGITKSHAYPKCAQMGLDLLRGHALFRDVAI